MLTRKALSRQEEFKLQLALQELKIAKEQCVQFNKEREENESELLSVLNNNSKLKSQLTTLHIKYNDVIDERDRLQSIIDRFDQCSDEYEQALRRTSQLEQELREAHRHISDLEETTLKVTAQQNISLYEELVGCAPQLVSPANPNLTIIDLTNEDSLHQNHSIGVCSRNKLKKYIKINKFIRKSKRVIKHYKSIVNVSKIKKEKLLLNKQFQLCTLNLEQNLIKHQSDTEHFETKIQSLQIELNNITNKYELSQKEIKEYSVAMDDLLKSIKYNSERFDSLVNNQCCICNHQSLPLSQEGRVTPVPLESQTLPPLLPLPDDILGDSKINFSSSNEIVMFSDDIGVNLGSNLSLRLNLPGQSFVNYCYPSANLHEIMRKIFKYKFNKSTILIIFVGNRGNVSKKDLTIYCEKIKQLQLKSTVMFTFPYIKNLSDVENNCRFNLNLKLDLFSTYNNSFYVIDSNSIVSKNGFSLTKGRYYLSKYYKRHIANLLSYFLLTSAKNLAKNTDSIEQYNLNYIKPLEFVPNNLN